MKTLPKAVIYARYSSHNQTEQSIEGQLRDAYAFADREGYQIVAEYIDRAQSATTDKRTDFQRMISDAQKRAFSVVIVWKLDRFARNRYDSAIYRSKLSKCGVKVLSVMENITDRPEGIILEAMLEGMAEYYSANLSENVKRGMRETVLKGRYAGGPTPYGYKLMDGHLVPDEKTAWVVRWLFDQYAQGVPKRDLFAELDRRGVRNARGGKLNYSCLARVLNNEIYLGRYHYGDTVQEDFCEPLTDHRTFDLVQAQIRRHAHAPAAAKAPVAYLLQGKAFCGHCGAPMVGESGRGRSGAVYHYYACAQKKKKHACNKTNEKKDPLEYYVTAQAIAYISDSRNARIIAQAVAAEYQDEFGDSKVKEMERALAAMNRDLDAMVDAIPSTPKDARPRLLERMGEMEAQRIDLEKDLAKLRVAQKIRIGEKEVLAWLSTFNGGDCYDPDFQRRVINALINAVYVYDDRCTVFFNIRGSEAQVPFSSLSSARLVDPPAPGECSDLSPNGVPITPKSEHCARLIVVDGVIGILVQKKSG